MEWIIVAVLSVLIIWAYITQYLRREKNEYEKLADSLRSSGVPKECIKRYIKEVKKFI